MDCGVMTDFISMLPLAIVNFPIASFWLNPASWWAMFQVVLGLGAVIFVHELGHFLVAKACGVKCEKFYVGFDAFEWKIGDRVIIPAALVKKQVGETEYGIGVLPFGGYVKMLGQDDNPANIEDEIQRSIDGGTGTGSGVAGDGQAEAAGMVDRDQLDPRSFRAKTVPQRMAIISAGVIFNLIFAVGFAAIAFRTGVDFEPPSIGGVIGGGPAWQQNLIGADLKKVNGQEINEEHYFTYTDFAQEVIFNNDDKPIALEIERYGSDETETVELTPERGFRRDMPDLPFLGISPRLTPQIGKLGAIKSGPAIKADPAFEAGDLVTAVNGYPVKTDIDLRFVLNRDSDQDAVFTLERTTGVGDDATTETINTTVGTNPAREIGFGVKFGPVVAIQTKSPAEAAGLKVGDELIEIDGGPFGDPLTLDQRMTRLVRDAGGEKTIDLTIKRDGEEQTLSISPAVPRVPSIVGPNKPVAIDSLGVAVNVTLNIGNVSAGSPAEEAGFRRNDELVSATYRFSDEQKKDPMLESIIDKTISFEKSKTSWAEVFQTLQNLEPGVTVEFVINREGAEKKLNLTTTASSEYFRSTRGIALTVMDQHYQTSSWSNAISLGARQVKEDAQRVWKFLGQLVSGNVSPKNLGGPGTIALAATSEASQGTGRLLLFLTLLSANLAIVNFLPIPILDGGHMLFLAYEGLFRRPVNQRMEIILTYGGLIFILGLMLFVVAMDIGRIGSLL